MPRFVIERTFSDGLRIPMTDAGAKSCLSVVDANAKGGVTWVHSYVTEDLKKTYCVYDGPSAEAVREAAQRTNLPIDSVTSVRVLDPYFYKG